MCLIGQRNRSPDTDDPNYTLCLESILRRRSLSFSYNGHRREVAPHVLGKGNGRNKLLAYQIGGETTSELPPGGQWRCFELSKTQELRLKDGPWRSGDQHRRVNRCVTTVDIDINPDAMQRFSWATGHWKE